MIPFLSSIFSKSSLRLNPPRRFLGLLLLAVIMGTTACGNASAGESGSENGGSGGLTISGIFNNYQGDSVYVWEMVGQELVKVAAAPVTRAEGNATYSVSISPTYEAFYLIGQNNRNAATVVLGTSGDVKVNANGLNIGQSVTVDGSPTNTAYNDLIRNVQTYQQNMGNTIQQMRMNMGNPEQAAALEQQLTDQQNQLSAFLDEKESTGGIVAQTANLYKFRVWGSDESHKTNYTDETDYFAKEFFGTSDLTDPNLGHSPILFYKAMEYVQTMPRLPGGGKVLESSIDNYLNKTPKGSVTRQVMMMGFITGAEQTGDEQTYIRIGNLYISEFPTSGITPAIQGKIGGMMKLAIGSTPPPISLPTPEGPNFSLEELKGKVVLIDFWASWCRPCRMENPNVVKLYNKYHSAGFDILSVSLDKTKPAWEAAIQQDGLNWHHVSDLQFWNCQAAKDYNVSSIPQTFLIDREGNIMAKNLRGEALAAKLKEIFGF